MSKVMTYRAHFRAILVLGLPLIGGHLAQFAIGLTDTIMLGWYGVEALAAVTLASSFYHVLFLFGGGFGLAVMPMVATAAAEEDETSIRRSTRMGLWLSLLYCALVLPLLWWSYPILIATKQDPQVAETASQYLRIAGWGLIPALLVMVLKSYLAALERTQVVFWVTVAAAVVNGLTNYALIFGNWGAPELGVVGAAVASVVTQTVALIVIVIYAVRVLPEHSLFQRFWRPDWDMFYRVLRLGLPIGFTLLAEVTLFATSAFMMGWIGQVPLAAHGIALNLASATFMLHLGLANVATIRAGNALGRKDRQHLEKGAIAVTAMSLIVSAMTIVLFVTCAEPLISIFVELDEPQRPQILMIGTGLLAMAALFQLVDGAQVIALGLLRGLQDAKIPMVIAGLSYWVVGIPASYYFGFIQHMEGIGVWLGLVLGLACAAILLMARFWLRSVRFVGVPAE